MTPEGFGQGLPVKLVTASLIPLPGWSSGSAGIPPSSNGSAANDCPLPVTVDTLATFSYNDPVVTSVSPSRGPSVGGTVVIVNGTNLGRALAATTGLGCNAVNRVWIGPWLCGVVEVGSECVRERERSLSCVSYVEGVAW